MQPTSPLKSFSSFHEMNIIKETRRVIKSMSKEERFKKAENHIQDALKYKPPRPTSESLESKRFFHVLYTIWTSVIWANFIFYMGYVYMYLVILDSESYAVKIGVEATMLALFFCDTAMEIYCKSFDKFKIKSKYSKYFYFKVVIKLLMLADLFIFIAYPNYDGRPIRPFRILRVFMPLLYDAEMRKCFQALFSAYRDILVFFGFYAFIIMTFAVIGSRSLSVADSTVDDYRTGYTNLSQMIFIMYVTATYDAYPDNQLIAIRQYEPNYVFFIVFIFLNMFIFSSIPGSLVYTKFRQIRSKMILVDEIKQQTSLILAFVTLTDESMNLSLNELIRFLLHLYKYKIRYVEYITDICLQLDDNNHQSIQVNQFMKISKILLENPVMLPPTMHDIKYWVRFRRYVNDKLHLKTIVQFWVFELCVSILIVLSFINSIFLLYSPNSLSSIFDQILISLFLAELLLRIVAIGPENFFLSRWNIIDFCLIWGGVAFYIVPGESGADGILRMFRLFRVASILRLLAHSKYLNEYHFEVAEKLSRIFSTMLAIFPIILKFVPFFMCAFFVFGILGMQFFYGTYKANVPQSILYNFYVQFSTFRSFVESQYIMVQIMTEAGWSLIAYDLAAQNPNLFALVMIFFCFMHVTIVLILATLIKGIFWEVYFTVSKQFEQITAAQEREAQKELITLQKKKQYQLIEQAIAESKEIQPNTILKREFYQNKLDLRIFASLRQVFSKERTADRSKSMRTVMLEHIYEERQIQHHHHHITEKHQPIETKQVPQPNNRKLRRKNTLNQIEDLDEEDFQEVMDQLLSELILDPKVKYTETIAYPRIFVDYLTKRMQKVEDFVHEKHFDLSKHLLKNNESMVFHTYEMHSILGIQTSKREQKTLIFDLMVADKAIDWSTADRLSKKKLIERFYTIDSSGTLRKVFLSQTNDALINKFEVQYFSDLYGNSFKQINKLSLEPLLRYEATLTYAMRNIFRYPQIDNTQFFQMLTELEDQISNKLLKRGSLFKFVYRLENVNDIWFSIEYKKQQEMRIHFIKTGIWVYNKNMAENQSYYGHDIFNWEMEDKIGEQYIKRFYQSFEGLAFSLLQEDKFFHSNPKFHIYDLYTRFINLGKIQRIQDRKLHISKIMLVVLTQEEEREDEKQLNYELSDILRPEDKKTEVNFQFDESDNDTFNKLKNLSAIDKERIVESEGLPFSYINNLVVEIFDILTLYKVNFINHIQRVLNQQFQETNAHPKAQKELDPEQFNLLASSAAYILDRNATLYDQTE